MRPRSTAEERAALDLSSWKVAFTGAEPVRAGTLDRFSAAFGPSGFEREAYYPCYGLAEATLMATGGSRAAAPVERTFEAAGLAGGRAVATTEGRALVGCGRSPDQQRLVVVDPETCDELATSVVGEIWIRGPSVARGYWRNPEASEETFSARTRSGDGPFLRTGDLGFLDENGELFVTGRRKDLIIIRGQNHYPQDLERTVEQCHPAVRPGCVAAFALPAGDEEQVAVALEVRKQTSAEAVEEVLRAVRSAVREHHEIALATVVLLPPGAIPKTSSGKIQRAATREAVAAGRLEEVARSVAAVPAHEAETTGLDGILPEDGDGSVPPADLIEYARRCAARALGVDASHVDPDRPASELGLDSLMAVELAYAVGRAIGASVPATDLMRGASLRELAPRWIERAVRCPPTTRAVPPDARDARPLSSGQMALWALHQLAPESSVYNLACAARVRSEIDVGALRVALQALIDRHPTLKTVYETRDGVPSRREVQGAQVALSVVDAAGWTDERLQRALADAAHEPFDLAAGPIFRVTLFRRAPDDHALLLAVHHIASDLWSLVVMMSEIDELYPAAREGRAAALPALEATYDAFTQWQSGWLASDGGERQRAYWARELAGTLPTLQLPEDHPRPALQSFRGGTFSFAIDADTTRQLRALARKEGTTLHVVLLAAFQIYLARMSGQHDVVVGSPVAGRPSPEFERVVGYFVNILPMRGDLSDDPAFSSFVARTRDAALGAIDNQDHPFVRLAEHFAAARDPSRSPLFQAAFVLERPHLRAQQALAPLALGVSGAKARLGGMDLEALPVEGRVSPFDLTLSVVEDGDALAAQLVYSTDLFAPFDLRPDGEADRHPAARRRDGTAPAYQRAAAARRGRARTAPHRLERDRGAVSRRHLHPRAVRGAGRPDTRRHRRRRRGPRAHLRRARRPRQSARASSAIHRRRPGGPGGHLPRAHG